jgi:hypothetical protein
VIVWLTDWAVQSYLDMKHRQVFTDQEYWSMIRPDVERLKGVWPSADPKFQNSNFWGPATSRGQVLSNGFKMKWHNVGSGRVQLRLCVVIAGQEAFLCQAYEKDAKTEARQMAVLRGRIPDVLARQVTTHGQI